MGSTMAKILVGTCSWTDKELIDSGGFYPRGARSAEERLRYYATQFPIVEVDSSYYALPAEQTAELWAKRTPHSFTFDVKAFRLFTQHPTSFDVFPKEVQADYPGARPAKNIYLRDVPEEKAEQLWDVFKSALNPIHRAGKLGVVLFQFPPWFYPLGESRDHILRCKEHLPDYQLAVEFRAGSWFNEKNVERTLAFLESNQLAFACVDGPQGFASSVPPLAYATAPVAVVRFHGRNTETWERRTSTSAERFDWVYQQEELAEWVPRVQDLAKQAGEVHLLMNTNRDNQGPVNANQLRLVLRKAGIEVEPPAVPQSPLPMGDG